MFLGTSNEANTKVDQKVSLSIHKSKAALTVGTHNRQCRGLWYTLYNRACLTFVALVTTCNKFVPLNAWNIRFLYVKHAMVARFMSSYQVKYCSDKWSFKAANMEITVYKIQAVKETDILRQVPSLLCCVPSDVVMRITTPSARRSGRLLLTSSRKLQPSAARDYVNCVSVLQEVHQQRTQKKVDSSLPADGATSNVFFLGEPVCFHCMIDFLLVAVRWWISVSSTVTTRRRAFYLYCITLQETETGPRTCCFVIIC
jgi:hypothetical protein